MTDRNTNDTSDALSEEIRNAYALFVINTEYKERFLMSIGLTRKTARIVINLEYKAAKYPLDTLLEAEQNLLRDSSAYLSSFKNSCGCLGQWMNPTTEIEKYKKLLTNSINEVRRNPIQEIQFLMPEKTFWQKLNHLFNLDFFKNLRPLEKLTTSTMDVFSLRGTDSPSFSKRLLNCTVTGCFILLIVLIILSVVSILIPIETEVVTSSDSQSNYSLDDSKSPSQSATNDNLPDAQFVPIHETPFNCFLKLDDATKRVIDHPKMNTDYQQKLQVREQLSLLRIQAIDIRENCSKWGTELCKLNSDEYLKDCQYAVKEQSSLLQSLDEVGDYSLN